MKTQKTGKRRVGLRFAGRMTVSLLAGVLIGVGVVSGGWWIAAALDWLGWAVHAAAPVLIAAAGVCGLAAAALLLRAGNRRAAAAHLDEEELDEAAQAEQETAIADADHRYSVGMTVISVVVVLTLSLFGLWVQGINEGGGPVMLTVGLMLAVVFAAFALQGALVRATKRLYPEKRGSILDAKFQKEWFDSCDEAERQLIWQCGHRSMMATSRVILVLFMLLIVFGLAADIGPLPMLVLGVVWLVQTLSYQLAALRLGSAKRKKDGDRQDSK